MLTNSKVPKPMNDFEMNRFDNLLAITLFFLNGMLLTISPNELNLIATFGSVVVLLVRNFRRIVLVGYDFYLLASAKNRDEIKRLLSDWRKSKIKVKDDDDE